jgi:hypothetical protein
MSAGEKRPDATEQVFRRANTTLEETYRGLVPASLTEAGRAPFICECSSTRCTAIVQLTLDEFEHIRERPDHFVVVPGHVVADFRRVVEETDRFAVLEKGGVPGSVHLGLTY